MDGKDLRGKPVRVTFDESVSHTSLSIIDHSDSNIIDNSALDPITIVAMIVAMRETLEMTVTTDIVVIVLGRLVVAVNMMVAVQGLLRGRIMMIEGPQGTMITGEEAMMTADHLIIMMIVVGMILTEDAMIEDAMKKKIVTKIGQQGLRMVMDGVEDFGKYILVAEKKLGVFL